MQTVVKQWGNSQGIRISRDILKQANIEINEILEIEVHEGTIIISKPFKHKTLEERILAYNNQLNVDSEFDWGEPVGREVW